MPKGSKKVDATERARRKLAAALLDLRDAQDNRTAAILRGEEEVRAAQERAELRSRKATERVERKAAAVARAEREVRALVEGQAGDRL
jgi:hypothetical protein